MRRWFSRTVVLLVIPAAAAWLVWDFQTVAGKQPDGCVEGSFRINDNGSPQVCAKR